MKRFWKDNWFYLCCVALVFVAMVSALILVPKAELHLCLNGVHNSFLDGLFRHYSDFVKWPVYILMVLPLLFWKQGWTVVFACTEAASALLVQVLKSAFNMPRPSTFFGTLAEEGSPLAADWQQVVVEGVNMHSWHSFPSGHSATFFVFFSVCAFIYAYEKLPWSKLVGLVCLVLALLGGYSRIYLSQHFLMDVCGGMTEGVLMSVVVFALFVKKKWTEKPWFEKNIVFYLHK